MPKSSFKIKKSRIQKDLALLSSITSPLKHLKAWRAWRENEEGYLTFMETYFFPDLFIYFGKKYTEKRTTMLKLIMWNWFLQERPWDGCRNSRKPRVLLLWCADVQESAWQETTHAVTHTGLSCCQGHSLLALGTLNTSWKTKSRPHAVNNTSREVKFCCKVVFQHHQEMWVVHSTFTPLWESTWQLLGEGAANI